MTAAPHLRTVALFVLVATASAAQTPGRRLTTIDAIRQFPGFYHLQNVLLRGEFAEDGTRIVLRADDSDLRVVFAEGVSSSRGPVEVRGQIVDVGKLEPADPRAAGFGEGREAERWPRPGEELFVRVTGVAPAEPPTAVSVRALALEPWRYEGQKVTVLANFRGRNLFGDLPGAPGKSPYDFVVRGAEGAIWVTGLRPRGRGFDLDISRRVDTDRWLEISGIVAHDRGLVRIEAAQLAAAKAPEITTAADEPEAAKEPPRPLEVVFSSPTDGDTDVARTTTVRIQFSRGVDEKTLAGNVRMTVAGAPAEAPPLTAKLNYDASNRALRITFAQPLEPFRTIRVELLEGLKAFDGGVVKPWSISFSVGQ